MRVSNITSIFEAKFGMMETLKMHLDAGFDAIDVSFHTKDSVLYALEDPTSLLKEMRSYVESRGAVEVLDELQNLASVFHAPPVLAAGREEAHPSRTGKRPSLSRVVVV